MPACSYSQEKVQVPCQASHCGPCTVLRPHCLTLTTPNATSGTLTPIDQAQWHWFTPRAIMNAVFQRQRKIQNTSSLRQLISALKSADSSLMKSWSSFSREGKCIVAAALCPFIQICLLNGFRNSWYETLTKLVDPWTTRDWTAWVHLYTDIFNKYILQYDTIYRWLNSRMRDWGYGSRL